MNYATMKKPANMQTIEVTPRVDCRACKGFGLIAGDSVPMPFGGGYTNLPADYCDCVLEQVPDFEIVLKVDDGLMAKHEESLRREAEYFAQFDNGDD